ncbi:hypothetical protein NDU88_000816 [Pleurodeles waltl]|uniref:Uncharacterized protein n=1 Tax=Pleurodeles waltl TaxID=8319 RepID=A0AAV7WK06_PLEWA|nr:hypothetical protein NDU88_000816 [Pleurodeles waltl]
MAEVTREERRRCGASSTSAQQSAAAWTAELRPFEHRCNSGDRLPIGRGTKVAGASHEAPRTRRLGLAAWRSGQEKHASRCRLIGLDPIPRRTKTKLKGSTDPLCSGLERGDWQARGCLRERTEGEVT